MATDLSTQHDIIYTVTLQPDGKIIAAGESEVDFGYPVVGLARYNLEGSLDTTFGIGGKVRMDLPADQAAYARFVGIQPEGKIVVAGGGETFESYDNPSSASFELARYNTTGLQIVSATHFDTPLVAVGGFWDVTLSGSNLTDRTYFDVRFRSPGSNTDQVALNWQQGTEAHHTVATGTEVGTWIITGIRAHESASDQGGEFVPVSASITVEK